MNFHLAKVRFGSEVGIQLTEAKAKLELAKSHARGVLERANQLVDIAQTALSEGRGLASATAVVEHDSRIDRSFGTWKTGAFSVSRIPVPVKMTCAATRRCKASPKRVVPLEQKVALVDAVADDEASSERVVTLGAEGSSSAAGQLFLEPVQPYNGPMRPKSYGTDDRLDILRIEDLDVTGCAPTHRTAQPLKSCKSLPHLVPALHSHSFQTLANSFFRRLEALAGRSNSSASSEEKGYHGPVRL